MFNTGDAYYTGPTPTTVKKQLNALTDAEIDQLTKHGGQFSLKISPEAYLKAVCTHRSADGLHDTLVLDPETGEYKCTLCEYQFEIIDPATCKADIKQAVHIILNYIQSIKVLYIDFPREAAREYYQIIALLEKLPDLFELAANNYLKHESSLAGWNFNNRNAGAAQIFNVLNNGMTGGMYQTAGMVNTAPYGWTPDGRPVVMSPSGEVPVGAAAPGMAMGSGMMGGAPGYQSMTTGYTYDPTAGSPAGPTQNPQTMMKIAYNMADQGISPEQIAAAIMIDVATVKAWLGARNTTAVPTPAAAPEGATTTTSFQA